MDSGVVSESLGLYTHSRAHAQCVAVFTSSGPLSLNLESVLNEQCDLEQVT